jgi:cytochrome c biogenesis protein CcmG/thiol:disulfide interchange protein DsbE
VYVWIAITLIAVAAGYYVLHHDGAVEAASPAPGLPPSAASGTAPAFTLTDISGKSVSLADFKGKVVVLDFWATWCPPCRKEIPDFISIQNEYGSQGVQIVGIALDELPKVQAFVRTNGMNYPVLMGNDAITARYGGIEGIPTTFIIDRTGKIAERFEGFRPRETFVAAITRLL